MTTRCISVIIVQTGIINGKAGRLLARKNMATVTITLADDGTDDGVLFRVNFDPPLKDEDVLTAAQAEAGWLIEVMQRRASGQSLKEMSEEMDDDLHDVEIALGQTEEEEKPN